MFFIFPRKLYSLSPFRILYIFLNGTDQFSIVVICVHVILSHLLSYILWGEPYSPLNLLPNMEFVHIVGTHYYHDHYFTLTSGWIPLSVMHRIQYMKAAPCLRFVDPTSCSWVIWFYGLTLATGNFSLGLEGLCMKLDVARSKVIFSITFKSTTK